MKSTSVVLKPMDFSEMEARFPNERAIRYNEIEDSSVTYNEIQPFLNRLPPREVDLIDLYYREGKNQKDIAKIFGVTQGAVSSRLARAKKRLQFLRDLPKVTDMDIERELGKFFDRIEIEIIKNMMLTTCQSRTASLINTRFNLTDVKARMTQVKVRHRFQKCLGYLKHHRAHRPELGKYCDLLEFISTNLYKLHEVKLPHFDRGARAIFSMCI